MPKKGLSQEMLKCIACVTMLVDHIGAVFVPGYALRLLGRVSFPIFCFLLVEGARHTRDPKRYALRLGIGALLSEIPYDLLFRGGIDWHHQNVMVTLLIGLGVILWAGRMKRFPILPLILGGLVAEAVGSDYGSFGVALIFLFWLTADCRGKNWIWLVGMAVIFRLMGSQGVTILGLTVPIQLFGTLAMVPIALYSGRKTTVSRWVQWGFYLFYPVHLIILLGVWVYV